MKYLSIKYACILFIGLVTISCSETPKNDKSEKPNVLLIMADDLGWGDTGFNGHPYIQTPHLDDMASAGVRMDRFYAAAPVCSPTRGSCLTGRNPNRYGIFSANVGSLPQDEITLAELLKEQGYKTGHFGKWHLGTLSKDSIDANRGGQEKYKDEFSPPWEHGFDVCFSTESKVPTWDPMVTPDPKAGGVGKKELGSYFGTAYWDHKGQRITENVAGDDSKVIMDRAIPFIKQAVASNESFFTVIWFHTPHTPIVAGKDYRELYQGLSEEQQHYYGCITAMDEQLGRLRNTLKELGVYENTLTFFTSDNGPENNKNRPRSIGVTNGLSERKRSLKEGGIRVTGLMEYPKKFPDPVQTQVPFSTSDYLPTILDVLKTDFPDDRPLDGESIISLMEKETRNPIAFQYYDQAAVIDQDFKIYRSKKDSAFALFNLKNDPAELEDLSTEFPQVLNRLSSFFEEWERSKQQSLDGMDYTL